MNVARLGERLANRLGGKITGLVGGSLANVQFAVDPSVSIAETMGNVISINPKWFNNQTRRVARGTLIHELTHVATQGVDYSSTAKKPWAQQGAEVTADAVRLALNGRVGINPDSAPGATQLARQEGWLNMGVAGPQVPGVGKSGGRMRNTAANIYSHNKIDYTNPGGAAALPALSPEQTANYYAQLQGLYGQYQTQLAALKQQRVGIKAGKLQQLADIKSQQIEGQASAEANALDRGLLGSSVDYAGRVGVDAAAAAAREQARSQAQQGRAQTFLQQQQANLGYFQGVQGLQAGALASQQTALANQLQTNAIISGQESTMDVLRRIYRSFANAGGNSSNTDGGTQFDTLRKAAAVSDFWLNLGFDLPKAQQMAAQVRRGYGPGMA